MNEEPGLPGWHRFIGSWQIAGAHPLLPGEPIVGTGAFEWLDGHRFVVWRTHYEHPRIPDALTVIGVVDDQLSLHYFDHRGVHRVYAASLDGDTWRYWRHAQPPDLSQRFTGTFGAGDETLALRGELSPDGATWEDDIQLEYRRTA